MAKQEYDNTNKGAVWAVGAFLNNDNAPVLRVKQDVDGVPMEVALFLNSDDPDIIDIITELVEVAEALREDGVKSPLFRTTIKPEEERGGGGSKRSSSRGSRRSGGRSKPSAAEKTDDGSAW